LQAPREKPPAETTLVAQPAESPISSCPPTVSLEPSVSAVQNRANGRLWTAGVVGLLVGLPLSWLLSYAAHLMFYLGLFFFALFGLVIGAGMFRVASPRGPYRRGTVLLITTIVVLATWGTSIVFEAHGLPDDTATKALRNRNLKLNDQTVAQYREELMDQVRQFLREQYPPGGTLGYVQWVFRSGKLSTADVPALQKDMRLDQRGYAWMIRVVLSIGLLAFGVASQTLGLTRFPLGK